MAAFYPAYLFSAVLAAHIALLITKLLCSLLAPKQLHIPEMVAIH